MDKRETVIFSFPGNENTGRSIARHIGALEGSFELRNFPDGESYVRIDSDVRNRDAIIICTLYQPNDKFLPLYFIMKTLRELGAGKIHLVAPYLSYMRQDKQFNPGEAVTSDYFGELLSENIDSLITIDPHLHRHTSLSEVYAVPSRVVHASVAIAQWISENIVNPVLIGPDSESEQWVSEVAKLACAPFLVLEKTRRGDREVEVSVPKVELFKEHTPVLVDDIISTAHTMIETVQHLRHAGMKAPICIGVHAVFAGTAYDDLLKSGVNKVVTCNTIRHVSNGIEISDLIVKAIVELM